MKFARYAHLIRDLPPSTSYRGYGYLALAEKIADLPYLGKLRPPWTPMPLALQCLNPALSRL